MKSVIWIRGCSEKIFGVKVSIRIQQMQQGWMKAYRYNGMDYRGEQFIVELKIWHGNEYNERGEEQLLDYLDYYRIGEGYMLSFNFNKKKETGVKEVRMGDKIIVEAVV